MRLKKKTFFVKTIKRNIKRINIKTLFLQRTFFTKNYLFFVQYLFVLFYHVGFLTSFSCCLFKLDFFPFLKIFFFYLFNSAFSFDWFYPNR